MAGLVLFSSGRQRHKHGAASFRRDTRAVAAVEFALLLPFLILAFIGVLELGQALNVDRKVNHAAEVVADLVSQYETLSSTELEGLFDASKGIMAPFSADDLQVVVAAVGIPAGSTGNQPKVIWSKARNTTAWSAGGDPPIALPTGISVKDRQIVVAQTTFPYKPIFPALAKSLLGMTTFNAGETFFLRPRMGDEVELTP